MRRTRNVIQRRRRTPRGLLEAPRPARAPQPCWIPPDEELRQKREELPGFRLLVRYLTCFPLQAASRLTVLSDEERRAMVAGDHGLWVRRDAIGRVPDRSGGKRMPWVLMEREKIRALAWVLMERENGQATVDRGVAAAGNRLCTVWACDEASLLRLSYVPREIVGLLDVRRGAAAERRHQARDVRRLRRLQALERPIPAELLGLEPTDRLQERMWWSTLGLDKESGVLSRQSLWDAIVVALLDALGAKTGRVPLRRLALDVCTLLRARYRNLGVPGPELIRKRYYRA